MTISISGHSRPRLRHLARRISDVSYRIDPRMSFILPWFFPVSLVAPSSFTLYGALTIPRAFLFLTTFPTIREFWRKVTTGGYVPIASDLFVCLTMIWMIAMMFIHLGPPGLVGYGSLSAIEFAAAYFMARAFFGTPAGFSQLTRVMRVVIVLILITALVDTASGQNIFLRFGPAGPTTNTFPARFGLVRAQGSLEHPILLGIFFVISAIFIFYSRFKASEKILWIGVCIFGAILPLSSAPLLSMVMSFGLIFVMRTLARFPWGTTAGMMVAILAIGAFVLFVDNPLIVLINNLTFDPQTGLFRVLIWQWAGVNIERAPWIGIGFAEWLRSDEMPPSIDCLYLVQAVRYGLPGLVLLLLTIFSTGFTMPLRPLRRYASPAIDKLRFCLGVCIFVICFNAFTVHFWGADWIMLAIVLGARAGLTESTYMSPLARGDIFLQPPEKRTKRGWQS